MPIFNAYDYLRPAIDSVLGQSLKEIELICVDDGSTDGSDCIIEEYAKNDARVKVIRQENMGPAAARNLGFEQTQGEYVAFLDADDFFEPDMLEKLYGVSKRDDLDICICKYDIYLNKQACFRANTESPESEIFDVGAITSKNEYPEKILQSTSGFAWNKLFRRSFLAEKRISFLEGVRMFEDVYFTVCALAFAERVGKTMCVLAHHRVYSQQTRAKEYKKHYDQVPLVFLRIKEFLMKGGMHQPLHKGFFNLSLGKCYHVYELLPDRNKESFWELLRESYVDALGWGELPVSEIRNDLQAQFLSSLLLYTYAQHTARLKRDAKAIPSEKVGTELVKVRKREKIKAFFKKLLGKGA